MKASIVFVMSSLGLLAGYGSDEDEAEQPPHNHTVTTTTGNKKGGDKVPCTSNTVQTKQKKVIQLTDLVTPLYDLSQEEKPEKERHKAKKVGGALSLFDLLPPPSSTPATSGTLLPNKPLVKDRLSEKKRTVADAGAQENNAKRPRKSTDEEEDYFCLRTEKSEMNTIAALANSESSHSMS